MSTLQVANIHLESTANNRIQYAGSNTVVFVAGGANTMSINASTVSYVSNVSFTNVLDSKGNIRDIPVNSQTSSYVTVAADVGKVITTNSSVTVNGAIFSSGQAVSIYNNSAANLTITAGTNTTIYLAGSSSTASRTLLQRGLATVLMVAANTFVVSGAGLV